MDDEDDDSNILNSNKNEDNDDDDEEEEEEEDNELTIFLNAANMKPINPFPIHKCSNYNSPYQMVMT